MAQCGCAQAQVGKCCGQYANQIHPVQKPCFQQPCQQPCPLQSNCNACNRNPCSISSEPATCAQIACIEQKICMLSTIINIILGQLPEPTPPPVMCFSEFHLPALCPDSGAILQFFITPAGSIAACTVFPIIIRDVIIASTPVPVDLVASSCNPTGSFALSCPATGQAAFTVPATCAGCYEVIINLSIQGTFTLSGSAQMEFILAQYPACQVSPTPTVIPSSSVTGVVEVLSGARFNSVVATGVVCLAAGQIVGPAFRFLSTPEGTPATFFINSASIFFKRLSSSTCVI